MLRAITRKVSPRIAEWNKLKVVIDDLEIYVLSRADLLKNKRAPCRAKDQGDIVWLEAAADDA